MQPTGGSAGARGPAADEVLPQSRREIVRRGLARSDLDWAKAVTGLREALLGMSGQLDALEQRVADLELERLESGHNSPG